MTGAQQQEDDILGAKLLVVGYIETVIESGEDVDIWLDSCEFCGSFPEHHGPRFIAACHRLEAWARLAFPSFAWKLRIGVESLGDKHCVVSLTVSG